MCHGPHFLGLASHTLLSDYVIASRLYREIQRQIIFPASIILVSIGRTKIIFSQKSPIGFVKVIKFFCLQFLQFFIFNYCLINTLQQSCKVSLRPNIPASICVRELSRLQHRHPISLACSSSLGKSKQLRLVPLISTTTCLVSNSLKIIELQ